MTERQVRSALKTCSTALSWEVAVALLHKAESKNECASLDWTPDKTMYIVVFKNCMTPGRLQPFSPNGEQNQHFAAGLNVLKRMHAAGFDVSLTSFFLTPTLLNPSTLLSALYPVYCVHPLE